MFGGLRVQRLMKIWLEFDPVLVKRQGMAESLDRGVRFRERKRLRKESHRSNRIPVKRFHER